MILDESLDLDGLVGRMRKSAAWRRKHRVGVAPGHLTADDLDTAASAISRLREELRKVQGSSSATEQVARASTLPPSDAGLTGKGEPFALIDLSQRRIEHVARAIWASQFDEDLAPPGTIEHALAMQMAVAATEALAEAMEMTS